LAVVDSKGTLRTFHQKEKNVWEAVVNGCKFEVTRFILSPTSQFSVLLLERDVYVWSRN